MPSRRTRVEINPVEPMIEAPTHNAPIARLNDLLGSADLAVTVDIDCHCIHLSFVCVSPLQHATGSNKSEELPQLGFPNPGLYSTLNRLSAQPIESRHSVTIL